MTIRKISVIVPVINEEKKIGQCLDAIFSQTQKPFEVIVVDGHSKDDTVKCANKYPVKILYEDYHTRAGACQVGINNANGDLIAFTDADCIPRENWLEKLVEELKEDIVGVGGGIVNTGKGLWEISINLAMDSFLGSANSVQGRLFKNKRYVNSISGCNCIYRKIDLIKVGGFDVSLTTAEDTDVNNKLLAIGKLIYTPDAIILHNHSRGLRAFAKRMYQYGYGRAMSRLWDLQVIPSIVILLLLLTLILTNRIFIFSIITYFVLIVLTSLIISIKAKNFKYFFPVSLVFIIEHIMYTIGFWKGFVKYQGD